MKSCLNSCGDCARAKNFPGCRRTCMRKSRAPTGAQDELVADLVRGHRGVGGVLRVDHELDDPRVVAQVDEDEATVVAAPGSPTGDAQPATLIAGAELTAIDVPPVAHPAIVSTRVSRGAVQSSRPCSRTVARPSSTITVQPAPRREAWVSWPFGDRPA